ncbi:MAG: hydantoinase/oxoprolinase family protein [Planctomycetaceae bacterium]
MYVIGLDIGGANIKAADNDGSTVSRAFALWREAERLTAELRETLSTFRTPDHIAVTMTGELCDCFATKADGVAFILNAVEDAANAAPVAVWQTGAEFVPLQVARDIPRLVAAANWHALATFCGRMTPTGSALLIDVGSTTTDVIPLVDGFPVPSGMTDLERLQAGELVYTGVRRTPICAVTREITFRESSCPLAAELFATTLDVNLLLGEIPADPSDCDTANGRPATIPHATNRLARMLCCDRSEISPAEAHSIAAQIAERQRKQIAAAITRVLQTLPTPCSQVILSGSGESLAREVVAFHARLSAADIQSLPEILSPDVAGAACAFAVAKLAAERVTSHTVF